MMKKIKIFLLSFYFPFFLKAQESKIKKTLIESQLGKTTYLIFPEAIEYFDLGEIKEFFTSKIENILKIKPLSDSPFETNMLVKTTEGSYFTFLLKNQKKALHTEYFLKKEQATYNDKPIILKDLKDKILDKEKIKKEKIEVDIKNVGCLEAMKESNYLIENQDEYEVEDYFAYQIEKQKVKMVLCGIYINESNMYFKIKLINQSPINFKLSDIDFTIIDKTKRAKTSSYQPKKIPILNKCDSTKEIKSSEEKIEIVVIKTLTLLDKETLILRVFEASPANRHLSLKIPSKLILNAKLLF